MPRRLLALLAVSLIVVGLFVARPILFPPTNTRITRENFERVMKDRSVTRMADVEAILGPPGDYITRPTERAAGVYPGIFPRKGWEAHFSYAWYGDDFDIRIWLSSRLDVARGQLEPRKPAPVGFFELLRWRWNHWRESRR